MELSRLRAFVTVADLRSFRQAAHELHLSPPALSRRVERLEERVGARLLERTSRSVRPSAVGEAFLERVRAVLEDLDDAVLGVHELSSGHTGRITVFNQTELTAAHVLASACLPSLFKAVEIDGIPYWDGGYSANPPLMPLVDHCHSADIVLVQTPAATSGANVAVGTIASLLPRGILPSARMRAAAKSCV